MKAYVIKDNNMSVSAAWADREEMLKQFASHLEDLEKDPEIQSALKKDSNACISISIEVAEITNEQFNEINSDPSAWTR